MSLSCTYEKELFKKLIQKKTLGKKETMKIYVSIAYSVSPKWRNDKHKRQTIFEYEFYFLGLNPA